MSLSIALIPYPAYSPVMIAAEVDESITATIGSDTAVGTAFIAGAITLPASAAYADECEDAGEVIETGVPSNYWSDPLDTTIRFVHGDDYPFLATITVNGQPFNLDGCTLRFTAKWKWTDADAAALIVLDNGLTGGITVTDAANGICRVDIPGSSTQSLPYYELRLVYDIQLFDTNSKRYTPMRGTLIVLPDSTRATT